MRACSSEEPEEQFLGFLPWILVTSSAPPGLLPWKPNLPGDFDFAWEGWWCVRLLKREQGFLGAQCWKGGVLGAWVLLFLAKQQTAGQSTAVVDALTDVWAPKDGMK